jgi:ABC-2 type transport system permease protein
VGIFENSRYTSVANMLLNQSVAGGVNADQRAVLQGSVATNSTIFRDGAEHDPMREMILPGLFLILFYLLIGFFGGQMLNSTIEEKENRTIEMLLTTVEAKTLISGKILSLVALAVIQGLVILLPILVMYFVVGPQLQLPNFDLANLPVDWGRMGIGALIFGFSFILFTGLLVAVGSAMPTAKEASQWFGIVMMLIFGPLYGVTAFVSYPDSPFVQFLSLFPLTSPIPLMLRNAVGNLPLGEALLSSAILAISAVLVMLLAVRIFQVGAMEYDSKLSLSALRRRRQQ